MSGADAVLSIDPGTRKCGVAVVQSAKSAESDVKPAVLFRAVVETGALADAITPLLSRFSLAALLIGDSTGSRAVLDRLRPLFPEGFPVHFVSETRTSERARTRWCAENAPAQVWMRILPGFRTPTEPVDDWAAVILAEDWFAAAAAL